VGLLYTKEPREVADEHIRIYNVQLPVFRRQEHDLTKPLDVWLYLLDTAHQLKKPINEVIEMDPRLKEAIDLDAGMKQFTDEYERVTADPKLRDEHALYVMECMRQNGMKRYAKQEGLEQGKEQLNRLISLLIRDNRQEDLLRSTTDAEYQNQLLREYQIDEV
jgi:hypothetical protein